jgi:hypothetical protein
MLRNERDHATAALAGRVPLSDIAHDDDACRCLPCRYSNALDELDRVRALNRDYVGARLEAEAERDAARASLAHARFMAAGWKRLAACAAREFLPTLDASVAPFRAALADARASLARAEAVVEKLAEVCDRIRAAHGMGCGCVDCRQTREALAAYEEGTK